MTTTTCTKATISIYQAPVTPPKNSGKAELDDGCTHIGLQIPTYLLLKYGKFEIWQNYSTDVVQRKERRSLRRTGESLTVWECDWGPHVSGKLSLGACESGRSGAEIVEWLPARYLGRFGSGRNM
jgi:hypothetical protein